MNKNTTNNKNNNKKTIRRKKSCKKRGNKCTQKCDTKYGGTKPNVCNELSDLKNSLDIFKYAIQLPKITK
jgi:hypothetical protein